MGNQLAPRKSALAAVPTRQELEALSPGDLWTLEERASEIQDACRELNDERLRQWVEVDGKTQAEIARLVGRSRSRIAQRCSALGLEPHSPRGRKRIVSPNNSGSSDSTDGPHTGFEEVIDAEVVEELPPPTERQAASIRRVEKDEGYEAGIEAALTFGVQHPDELERAPDPGPRVKCPTCGHMVKPEDFKRGV